MTVALGDVALVVSSDFVRDRAHARLIPAPVSDLFSRSIRDAYNHTGAQPTAADLFKLAAYYGITPTAVTDLITQLAQERHDLDRGVPA